MKQINRWIFTFITEQLYKVYVIYTFVILFFLGLNTYGYLTLPTSEFTIFIKFIIVIVIVIFFSYSYTIYNKFNQKKMFLMLSYRNLIFAFSSLLILSYLIYKLIIPLDETINFQFLILSLSITFLPLLLQSWIGFILIDNENVFINQEIKNIVIPKSDIQEFRIDYDFIIITEKEEYILKDKSIIVGYTNDLFEKTFQLPFNE